MTIYKFSAPWCGPCKSIEKTLEQIKTQIPSFEYINIDIDDNPELAKKYKIKSLPTLIFEQNEVEVERLVGIQKPDTILHILQKVNTISQAAE